MGLQYKILERKPTIEYEGMKYKDLMADVINHDVDISGSFIMINKEYTARPDLVSLAVYGSEEYADILCKINGISNPFELNENDIIIIPHIETLMEFCKKEITPSAMLNPGNENDSILNTLGDNKLQKKPEQRRSSNEMVEGEQNYLVDTINGLIIY